MKPFTAAAGSRRLTPTLYVALLTTLATAAVPVLVAFADQAEPGGEAVVPEGRDELLGEMLGKGATLPDGCKLNEGRVEYTTVKATYGCPTGEVVYELSHPSRAGGGAARTDRFALTLQSGSPPAGLEPALIALIRSREAAFEWKWIGPPADARGSTTLWLAAATLTAVAILGWIFRSRTSARRDGPK
jgi:hypothetical protein